MIQGFPIRSSLFPGDTLTLHVSTDAPEFRVDIYRQGAALTRVCSSGWFTSPDINLPDHDADQDWSQDQASAEELKRGWPGFDIMIPADCRSGVYIAMFIEGDGSGNARGNTPPLNAATADARFGKALFVVRKPTLETPSRILYKLPLFTYHAYNDVGGWCFYSILKNGRPWPASLRRPGGGTGGHSYDEWNYDPADRSSTRQVFAHWDAPFIAWLEQNGYAVDYATDLDLHTDPNLLSAYSLMLSVGHDEYWSLEMRDRTESFIRSGGNVAFFSGNICWWAVEFTNDFIFYRRSTWWKTMRPENSLTGVSFRNGALAKRERTSIGYVVQNHDHWIFEHTGLKEGDHLGVAEQLVGYEADGANFDRAHGPPFVPRLDDGTPATFVILGVGDLTNTTFEADGDRGNRAATMGVYTNGGTVFTAATTDWPRVVALDREPRVVQVTHNVLNRLSTARGQATARTRLAEPAAVR